MRNYIKYPPLEWLKNNKYCKPSGPNFSVASKVSLLVGSNRIGLLAPKQSSRYSSIGNVNTPEWQDVLTDNYLGKFPDGVMDNDYWGSISLFGRMWAFYGPWMSGCKGALSLSVSIVGRQEKHQFSGLSFFNPKAFEMILVQYLNDFYGHRNWGNGHAHIPRHHGPVDWQCHNHLPVPSASFKIYKRGDDMDDLALPDCLFVFPISDEHFIEVCFVKEYLSRDEKGEIAFDTAPMQELQDNVFSSISLQLSSKAQARVDKINAEVGNMQMCKEFSPLKWPTNVYPPAPSGQMPEQHSLRAGN